MFELVLGSRCGCRGLCVCCLVGLLRFGACFGCVFVVSGVQLLSGFGGFWR